MQQDVKLSDITPPKDYSYDPEELNRLRESIKNNGLFHPIILQGDNPPYRIVSGRARFISCIEVYKDVYKDTPPKEGQFLSTEIQATILPENCPNPHEISLHENLRRNNLSWYEQVELEKELHDLRVSQHGEKAIGRPKAGEKVGWSQNDTARELNLALGTFSQDMALAIELKRNPNLRNIKDKTTALKVIKQIVKRQNSSRYAEIEQLLPSEIEMNEVYLGDSEIILKTFPNETFDCCITDPPWSEYKDEALRSSQETLLPIFLELFRVLHREAFLFIITSSTDFYFYKRELPKLGFRVQSYPILWHKPKTITYDRAPWQFARDYEPIIVAVKGDPSLTTGIELSAILKFDNLHYTKMIHPHEKPLELIEYLLKVSTHPGAKIVDPFSGSGVTLEACKKNDRSYIGIEKEKKFYEGIVERLK